LFAEQNRTVHVPATSVVAALSRPVLSNPPVICATQTPYIVDVENSDEEVLSFPAMRNPIHTLISSSSESITSGLFLAADSDRYINVFDPSKTALAMNLVAEKEVSSLSLYPGGESCELEKQVLAALIEDGTVELFNRPFVPLGPSQGSKAMSLKAKGRQMTRKADAVLKIVRPENRKVVSVVKTEFHGPELFVAWAEGGVNVIFERVRWQDENTEQLAFSGVKEVKGRKSASVLNSAAVNGARDAGKSHVDENSAVVELGAFADDVEMNDSPDHADVVSISSDEEVSDAEEEATKSTKVRSRGKKSEDVEMQDAAESEVNEEDPDEEGGEEQEAEELTFGELVQRQAAPTAIDVEAELEDEAGAGPLISGITTTSVYQIPSGVSLSTVLSQALKTNDNDMLESCFHTGDLNIIRTTIQRLDSTLAGALLQRLAERMASRPGRYGHLLVWVQWTCIAHGGVIAGKTALLDRMSSLFKIMDQRSSSLPSLLLLKGKLDMLDAQLGLRQSMADHRTNGLDDQEMLENVTHYQGVNDDSEVERPERRKKSANASRVKSFPEEEDENEDEAIPNGIGSGVESDNDEEEGSEEEVDDHDLIDIEAEEYAGSSDAEESLEDNEEEEDEDDEEDSDAGSDMVDFIADSEEGSEDEAITTAPPPKKAKLGKKPAGRR
jgi:U3 small nucleolar RNA-associated protein 5